VTGYDVLATLSAIVCVFGFYLMARQDESLETRQRLYWYTFAGPILIVAGAVGALWWGMLAGLARLEG
jgi:hypothetical protein